MSRTHRVLPPTPFRTLDDYVAAGGGRGLDASRRVVKSVIVDELIGKQEVVIKSLGRAFEGVRGVAGGAILGDGRVGLILDAGGLAGLMGKDAAHQAA
jgi:hypothetical protein